jgi:hypothetical protein
VVPLAPGINYRFILTEPFNVRSARVRPENRDDPRDTNHSNTSATRLGEAEFQAAVVVALLWSVVGAAVLERLAPGHLRLVGALSGDATFAQSLATWLGLCLLLSFGFAYVVSRSPNRYTNAIVGLTSRSATLRRLLMPAVRRSMLGTTGAGIGTLFGLVAAVTVGFVGVPGAVAAATATNRPSPSSTQPSPPATSSRGRSWEPATGRRSTARSPRSASAVTGVAVSSTGRYSAASPVGPR